LENDNALQTKRATRRGDFVAAVRAHRVLVVTLRSQGMNEEADRYAYRAQVLQRQVLRQQGIRKWLAYVGSLVLDFISGYGYRPVRSFLVYVAAIVWFAIFYRWLGALPSLDAAYSAWRRFMDVASSPANPSRCIHPWLSRLAWKPSSAC
jgi:hypothetical protein